MTRPLHPLFMFGCFMLAACGGGSGTPKAEDPAIKALLATLPAAYQHADLENGQAQSAQCRTCHLLDKGAGNGVGPNLYGIFGRQAGTAPGFAYSPGVKALGWAWDADKINRWITDPRSVVPGTKMSFAGLQSPKDRADLIAYLKVKTSS